MDTKNKKYRVLLPIAYGTRVEKGTVLRLPADVAKRYSSRLELVNEVAATDAENSKGKGRSRGKASVAATDAESSDAQD